MSRRATQERSRPPGGGDCFAALAMTFSFSLLLRSFCTTPLKITRLSEERSILRCGVGLPLPFASEDAHSSTTVTIFILVALPQAVSVSSKNKFRRTNQRFVPMPQVSGLLYLLFHSRCRLVRDYSAYSLLSHKASFVTLFD